MSLASIRRRCCSPDCWWRPRSGFGSEWPICKARIDLCHIRADHRGSRREGTISMPLESIETAELSLSDARWQARVDLAAAHRLCVREGLHEGIFNHLTLRVPGTNDRYYQIPFGLHWSEVTASCFMEVGYDGEVLAGEGYVERSAYCI